MHQRDTRDQKLVLLISKGLQNHRLFWPHNHLNHKVVFAQMNFLQPDMFWFQGFFALTSFGESHFNFGD